MDRLTSMTVFARVAATRSFSAAARDLGISQATASKHVQTLEDWIGTRLLHRTTRRVGLTEAGESFFAQCTRILEDMETARQVGRPDARIRGSLRFTAPVSFGTALLGPILVGFMQQHPDLTLNVTLVDRAVDLMEEGYDLALQVIHGPLEAAHQPGMLIQQLMPMPFEVCAAPDYLAGAGTPETPADLARHVCLADNRHPGDVWRFVGPEGAVEDVPIPSRMRSDNGVLRREAARAGGGILLAPAFLLADDVAAGRLVRLLPGYRAQEATLCAVCHSSRAALPKMRALIGFLMARFQPAPETGSS
ncbi:MAG: LysR family transcriptional regulator [Rhodospirillales bacterium]|nr:LysR family transcriptional regulator [Rhodospirillales bacterium]